MASMRSTLTISISTPASSNFLRKVLNWATVRDRRHFCNSSAAAPCAACCSGVNGPRRPPVGPPPPGGGAGGGGPSEGSVRGGLRSSGGGTLLGLLLGSQRPAPPSCRAPPRGWRCCGRRSKEGFDGLRPQLHGAESELHRIIERFVRAHIIVAVAVRHVDADLYSAELGIRLCQEARAGESRQRHPP